MSGSKDFYDEARIAEAKSAVDDVLDLWKAPEVSADFDRRLYARIEERSRWWDFLRIPRRLVPVATAACVVIVAGLWVGWPDGDAVPPAAPKGATVESLRPDQAAKTLQEMQMIEEFNRLVHPETAAEPKM